MAARDPYWALGLCCNPFVAEQSPGVPDGLWVERGFSTPAPQAQLLVQLMGEKGAGKTSHLLHWQAQTGGPYVYYPEGPGRWTRPPVEAIAYWDEANRIPKPLLLPALAQAARTQATIVVGTHADLSLWASLCGLAVRTLEFAPLDVDTLMAWANRRIAAVRSPDTDTNPLELPVAIAHGIVAQSGASWRTAATHLHIWAAAEANRCQH